MLSDKVQDMKTSYNHVVLKDQNATLCFKHARMSANPEDPIIGPENERKRNEVEVRKDSHVNSQPGRQRKTKPTTWQEGTKEWGHSKFRLSHSHM